MKARIDKLLNLSNPLAKSVACLSGAAGIYTNVNGVSVDLLAGDYSQGLIPVTKLTLKDKRFKDSSLGVV